MNDCPLCLANHLLKTPVLAETPSAFLTPALSAPGNYLLVPARHVEALAELPANWWGSATTLLAHIPDLGPHYNLTFNVGQLAGQTVKHLHCWVIPRHPGHPASGKGLARLIHDVGQAKI